MSTRLLAPTLLVMLLACGTSSSTSSACTNRLCGDYCDTCITGSGTTCQHAQGVCDANGQCRIAFDPASTDPAACRPCRGQACI